MTINRMRWRRIALPLVVALIGVGLGTWAMVTPAHGTVIALQPLTITKITTNNDHVGPLDNHVAPGGTVYYKITITNPNDALVYLDSITDTLPSGFTYNSQSTTGDITSSDPTIAGQTLTWLFDGENVGGLSSATLDFSADASQNTGMYCNNASVDWGTGTASTGATAAVQVLTEGDTPVTPTCPGGTLRTATPTSSPTSPATATSVPDTATATPVPPTATATQPAGGSAGVISAPNTGSGPDASQPSTLLLAIAAIMVVGGAGAAAAGAIRR